MRRGFGLCGPRHAIIDARAVPPTAVIQTINFEAARMSAHGTLAPDDVAVHEAAIALIAVSRGSRHGITPESQSRHCLRAYGTQRCSFSQPHL